MDTPISPQSGPVRMLHFADLHIGTENYGATDPQTGLSTRLRDFLRRMDEMIDDAREHDVDLVIFAGDAFKSRNPNATFQREFAWRVRDLADLAPTVLLVGNHDVPPNERKASSIEIYATLAVPNVWVADEYDLQIQPTKRGPVAVAAAPYPIRSRILADQRTTGQSIAETDRMVQRALMQIIDDLAERADAHAGPRVLTGHFTVSGAVYGSERGIMLGRDIQVLPSALMDNRWDYVALGHIHKHQNLSAKRPDAPPVVYSGSLERIDFGEEGDPKGYCWVELARGATEWRFVRSQARPFVTLSADLRDVAEPTAAVIALIEAHDLSGAITRLRLKLTQETEARLNEGLIRDALRQAGVAYIAAIAKDIEQPARARLGGSPEELSDEELLDHYLKIKGMTPERRELLMAAAAEIFEQARAAT
ncbi:MAG: exonuclease SbcCD subunit D [Chloroflexi bacterium]|nr:exonuclease SbcCD subunit D [Chloroflexota bacterium]